MTSNTPPPPAPLDAAQIAAYLDYAGTDLLTRRDELIKALHANAQKYPRIDDDDVLGRVGENIGLGKKLAALAETARETTKKPFWDGGKAVDAWFRAFLIPLAAAVAPVQTAMNDYGQRLLAKRRAEQDALRARAQAEADRLAEIAAAAIDKGGDADVALEQAGAAAGRAEQADTAASARAPDLTRSYGSYGSAISARESWSWEVTDEAIVPRAYMMISPDAIKAAGKVRDRSGKPTKVIPGIRWVSTTKVGVR